MKKTLDLTGAIQCAHHHDPLELTLAELARAFDIAHPSATEGPRLRKWLEAIGEQSAWSITAEQLTAAGQHMLEVGYSPSSVNRDMSSLGSLFKWARHKRYAPSGFVSPTVSMLRHPEPLRRIEISSQELDAIRLFAKLSKDKAFHAFICLLIDTGARKGELLERRWQDIDLINRQILLKTSKTGKPRYLFFTEATGTLLKAIRPADLSRLVFEGRGGVPACYRKPWIKAVTAINRAELHLHDIRHAAAASLLRSGVTISVAAQVLGHSSLILQRRYGHLETETLRSAQERRWTAHA